jgi:predicted RNase H-like HicB family nuclease
MPVATHQPPKILNVELDHEADGRWIADVPELPGVLVYGGTREDALAKVQALALRVLADMIEQNGPYRPKFGLSFREPVAQRKSQEGS